MARGLPATGRQSMTRPGRCFRPIAKISRRIRSKETVRGLLDCPHPVGAGRSVWHARLMKPHSGRGILASWTGGPNRSVGCLAKSHSESHRWVRANRPSQRWADIIVSWAAVNSFLPENIAHALNPEPQTSFDRRAKSIQSIHICSNGNLLLDKHEREMKDPHLCRVSRIWGTRN
jgi:hypothetical protein